MPLKLSDRDIDDAAHLLNCERATILAVLEVESNGNGFLPDGRPVILFEAHLFGRFTDYRYNKTHPSISRTSWTRSLYKGGAAEHSRLEQAMILDREAALMSCSWGLFQILGSNYRAAGFTTLQQFVNAMWRSEGDHLKAFVSFVKTNKLDDDLREKRWSSFARGYNGPRYAENRYHIKLANSYKKFARAAAQA
jgi:hypothetical protein